MAFRGKYVPRSIENIFDRIEARNERIDKESFSTELSTTFEVIVYDSSNPEKRNSSVNISEEDSGGLDLSEYVQYSARSVDNHDLLKPDPMSAKSVEEYERLRNIHYQAFFKKASDAQLPQTGDTWNATVVGKNVIILTSKVSDSDFVLSFSGRGGSKDSFNSSNSATQTNNSYSAEQLKGTAPEPNPRSKNSLIVSDTFPFFNIDPTTNRQLLDFIARGEAIKGSYNSANRIWYKTSSGGSFTLNTWPKTDGTEFLIDGKKINESTIARIMDLQSPYGQVRYPTTQPPAALFAVGRYQVIPVTMKDYLLEAGLKKEDIYSDANQDRFALNLIYGSKRPALRKYLLGDPNVTLDRAQTNFAQEWSSVPTPDGTSYYGNEKAGHGNSETRKLLENIRKANMAKMGVN